MKKIYSIKSSNGEKSLKLVKNGQLSKTISSLAIICLCFLSPFQGFSQNNSTELNDQHLAFRTLLSPSSDEEWKQLEKITKEKRLFKKDLKDSDSLNLKEKSVPLTVFGYYRLPVYARNIKEPYPNLEPYTKSYGLYDGYREPLMSVSVIGRPNGKTTFATEFFIYSPYEGGGTEDNVFSVNLGLNFYGNFRTDVGSFGIRAGGIHWYNLSPFTIGVYQLLDRYSIFERTPWEGVRSTDKYNDYFNTGSTNAGDLRWNNQAFQGIILNGNKLPAGFSFDLFWGKTQPNGGLPNAETDPLNTIFNLGTAGNVPHYQGFNGDARVFPSYITGGKLSKKINSKNSIAYNVISSRTAVDSLSRDDWRAYQVHSLSYNLNIKNISVTGELAAGSYKSPVYDQKWGEALMLKVVLPKLRFPKGVSYSPLDIQVYQISKDFYNENGEIGTGTNPDINGHQACEVPAGGGSIGGQITQVNQLVHNRRGVNINTGISTPHASFNVGWGFAAEIDPITSSLSYVHRVNGLAMSRVYQPFPLNATCGTVFGPYNRQYSYFRGVFEVVRTTDLHPATATPVTTKYYNSVDLQAKFKGKLLDRKFFVFYLGTFGSAKSQASLIPSYSENSYLFVQYHELDLYYEIFKDFIATAYIGIENTRGGRFTEWDVETQLPRDQLAKGFGVGFDYTINENVGLYLRRRWMRFNDRSFGLDHYKGNETTIELKIFF